MLIDLHTHSSESDGSLTPEDLAALARREGVAAIALCDHDTTGGLARFAEAGKKYGVETIPGVEISAAWSNGNCHILGLGLSRPHAPLEEALKKIRDGRGDRNMRIIEKLNSLGIDIHVREVKRMAGGDVIGRPHMARVMHEKGYVQSVQEAFDKYLAKGAPAYVDRFRLEPPDAVSLLRDAGCVVVLAHPAQLCLDSQGLNALVAGLIPFGLTGIEAYSPYDGATEEYRALASQYALAVTGGSDFHGISKPDLRLGYYGENTPIPVECLDSLRARMGPAANRRNERILF